MGRVKNVVRMATVHHQNVLSGLRPNLAAPHSSTLWGAEHSSSLRCRCLRGQDTALCRAPHRECAGHVHVMSGGPAAAVVGGGEIRHLWRHHRLAAAVGHYEHAHIVSRLGYDSSKHHGVIYKVVRGFGFWRGWRKCRCFVVGQPPFLSFLGVVLKKGDSVHVRRRGGGSRTAKRLADARRRRRLSNGDRAGGPGRRGITLHTQTHTSIQVQENALSTSLSEYLWCKCC